MKHRFNKYFFSEQNSGGWLDTSLFPLQILVSAGSTLETKQGPQWSSSGGTTAEGAEMPTARQAPLTGAEVRKQGCAKAGPRALAPRHSFKYPLSPF